MRLTYDPACNIAYLRFRERQEPVETIRLSDEINIDIAPDRTLYGIERLNANAQLTAGDNGRVVVVDPSGTEHSLPLAG